MALRLEELGLRRGVLDETELGIVGQPLAPVAAQQRQRLTAHRRHEPAVHGARVADAVDVAVEQRPRRLQHVLDVGRREAVGAQRSAQPRIEASHEFRPR
jgi:hypothetical protein